MRGIIGFTGKNAILKNILLLGLIAGLVTLLIKMEPKYFASKTVRHGYWGVEEIDSTK
jgi:hypothetical protein